MVMGVNIEKQIDHELRRDCPIASKYYAEVLINTLHLLQITQAKKLPDLVSGAPEIPKLSKRVTYVG